jgi:hypothetical protein
VRPPPGHRDDLRGRVEPAQRHDGFQAVFFRHHQVGDHQVARLAAVGREGDIAVPRIFDFVARGHERLVQKRSHPLVIFHQQDRGHV